MESHRGYEAVKFVQIHRMTWAQVCEPFPFFERYGVFLRIEMFGRSQEAYTQSSGFAESKLQILTKQFEAMPGFVAHLSLNQYTFRSTDRRWPFGCAFFLGLGVSEDRGCYLGQPVDLRAGLCRFSEVLDSWVEGDHYHGRYAARMQFLMKPELSVWAREDEDGDTWKGKQRTWSNIGDFRGGGGPAHTGNWEHWCGRRQRLRDSRLDQECQRHRCLG